MSFKKSVPIGLYIAVLIALESVGVEDVSAKDMTRRGIIKLLNRYGLHSQAEEVLKVWR